MHIKRFEAPTILEAIRQVKAELGPDALILSQKSVRRDRSWFGLGGQSVVEVMAAVDREVLHPEEERERVRPDPSWRGLEVTRALIQPLEEEVRSLRQSIESANATLGRGADLTRAVDALRLATSGLAPRHARSFGGDPSDDTESGELPLRRALAQELDRRLRPPRDDETVRAELFVGPTGVGKTTTLAKLAARGVARDARVAVVTTDALRLGGDASLRGVAGRLGVPFQSVTSPGALGDALGREPQRRVLVDTAGRSPADADAIAELVACREALGSRTRVNLVLSATTKEEDLRAALDLYRPLRPDGLVITKVDESARLDNVVNFVLDAGTPTLSWLGCGQRIPEDLRLPDPDALAGAVLGAVP